MEKQQLIKVLQNYPASTAEEAQELLSLKEKFPFSQLLHVLSARACKDHSLSQQQNELQLAAVYSADRGILKSMMSGQGYVPEMSSTATIALQEKPNDPKKDKKAPLEIAAGQIPDDNDDLAGRVIRDLQELNDSRHKFEMMFVYNPGTDPAHAAGNVEEPDHGKSKRERIIELSKALNPQQTPGNEEVKPSKKKKESRKDLIDEIVNTKIEIEPENEKQKEQIELIDHFIKAQPSISNSKDKPANIKEGDLSTIKTGEFGDNIVTETLVEILLKQGKKDKAIEVLKKLIWKFPQKKAYFATQIEELKK